MPFEEKGMDATAQLVLTAGILIAAGIKAGNHLYKEHKDAKLLAQIEGVNTLWRQHLSSIPVTGFTSVETVKFAPIFEQLKTGDPKSPNSYRSLMLSEAILEDIDNQIPMYPNPHLAPYSRSLLNALTYLREFYDDRLHERTFGASPDDVTSSVICYLILMICIHCIKFEGSANGIAYLDGLSKFVNAYASLKEKDSQRYERLTLVYGELVKAQYQLIDHSRSNTHIELVQEFLPICTHHTEMLLKSFIKLFTPKSDWRYVDTATLERLAIGVLKPQFKHNHNLKWSKSVQLKNSIFKNWMMKCAQNFLLAQCVDKSSDEKEIQLTDKDIETYVFKKEELAEIKSVFNECPNFLTLKAQEVSVAKATNRFKFITDEAVLKDRVAIFLEFFILIDRMITVQYLALMLWNRINELVEMYVSDASHECNFIFEVFINLGEEIKSRAQQLLEKFEIIHKENAKVGAMLDQEQNKLAENISMYLKSILGRFYESIQKLTDTHAKRQVNQGAIGEIDPDKDKILKVVTNITLAHGYKTDHKLIPEKSTSGSKSSKAKWRHTPSPVQKTEAPELKATPQPVPANVSGLSSLPPPAAADHKEEKESKASGPIDLDKDLSELYKIIKKRQVGAANVTPFLRLYNALGRMRAHIHEMEVDHRDKAKSMTTLMTDICKEANNFLSTKISAIAFSDNVHTLLNPYPQQFMVDAHKSSWSKFCLLVKEVISCICLVGFYRVAHRGGFLKTDSRVLVNEVEEASHNIKDLSVKGII